MRKSPEDRAKGRIHRRLFFFNGKTNTFLKLRRKDVEVEYVNLEHGPEKL